MRIQPVNREEIAAEIRELLYTAGYVPVRDGAGKPSAYLHYGMINDEPDRAVFVFVKDECITVSVLHHRGILDVEFHFTLDSREDVALMVRLGLEPGNDVSTLGERFDSIRTLTTEATPYADEAGKALAIREIVEIYAKYVRHSVRLKFGLVTRHGEARQVDGGDNVQGPWVFSYSLSTCIDQYGGSGAQSRRNREDGFEFSATLGDRFVVDGLVYELTDTRRMDYPQLTLTSI